MAFLVSVFNVIFHIDKYLVSITSNYGLLTYLFLFLIVLAETGLVLTPFLPGDSLLFAAGSIAANSSLNVLILLILLISAAILGDSFNYFLGYQFGEVLFTKNRFFHPEYLQKTQQFYEKHGNKTIILARFIPIIRTFAPFIAGIGKMKYSFFLMYNVIGGIAWVSLFILSGYFLGKVPLVKENFSLFVILIILTSLIPLVLEAVKHYRRKNYPTNNG